MKKIFTLICLAFVTINASAQREIWDPNAEDVQALITTALENPTKLANDNFLSVPASKKIFDVSTRDNCQASGDWSIVKAEASKIEMTTWILETGTPSVKLKVVSTPDTGDAADSPNNGLQMAGDAGGHALSGVEGFPTFTKYLKSKNGVGGIAYMEFYELNSEGNQTFRVVETPWTADCGQAPAKGFYCQFTPSKDGSITAGIWMNKNLKGKTLFVVDGSDFKPVPNLKIQGFRNDKTYEFKGEVAEGESKPVTCIEWTLDENHQLVFAEGDTDTNRPFFAYVTWEVKKDVNYYLLGGNNSIGISGFFFDETDPAHITSVQTEKADAPTYNLAGQRVNENFKGVVIQNGKKVMNK